MRWKRGTHREAPGASSLLDYGRRCIPRQASTWIRKCGFATAEYPRSPNATPAAPSRRCRAGKRFADNFISKFSEPLDPNPQWRKHRGNVAANLGSLDRHPRVRQIASGTSNPWQSSPFHKGTRQHHRQFTGTARERRAEVAPWRNATRPVFDISAALTPTLMPRKYSFSPKTAFPRP
jgi:hypothetical protein